MINEKDIIEIKNRDFLKKIDHYHDHDNIKTNLIIGKELNHVPTLTIILPVYDHPIEFIIRAINSALNQDTEIDFQLLIIDDYCKNGSSNGVEEYLNLHYDKRILYYKNEQNLGVFGNWNRGVSLSKSKWVTILHSDDFYKPNFINVMFNILKKYPEIDQIACRYKLLDYTKGEVKEEIEHFPTSGIAKLRKVDYREYMYEMFTSVKGSIYKRDSLINIGGFRSQGDGLGLDDYPLMMKYAYYYNTYYLDAVLYVDSWGYNDSLNTKHWYPELIENYYLWMYYKNIEPKYLQWAYKYKARYLLIKRAKAYANGTSMIHKKIDINYDELYSICQFNGHYPLISTFFARCVTKLRIIMIRKSQKSVRINLAEV